MKETDQARMDRITNEFVAAVAEENDGFVALCLRSHGPERLAVATAGLLNGARHQLEQVNYARFVAVRDARLNASAAQRQLELARRENERLRMDISETRKRVSELREILAMRAKASTKKRGRDDPRS